MSLNVQVPSFTYRNLCDYMILDVEELISERKNDVRLTILPPL
jgi:hypothetical protein